MNKYYDKCVHIIQKLKIGNPLRFLFIHCPIANSPLPICFPGFLSNIELQKLNSIIQLNRVALNSAVNKHDGFFFLVDLALVSCGRWCTLNEVYVMVSNVFFSLSLSLSHFWITGSVGDHAFVCCTKYSASSANQHISTSHVTQNNTMWL